MKSYPPYSGPVTLREISGQVKTAYECYQNQLRRCYTKNNPRYKDNGAKGIEVLYSLREFIAWYLHHINLYTGKRPSVGRIDHSKSYSFDNIRIESLADNSMERINRVGTTRPRREVYILDGETKERIYIARSMKEAGKLTGVHPGHIGKYCRGVLGISAKGFSFELVNKEC